MHITDQLIRQVLTDLQYAGHITTPHEAALIPHILHTANQYAEEEDQS